jgi:hypothetical protein
MPGGFRLDQKNICLERGNNKKRVTGRLDTHKEINGSKTINMHQASVPAQICSEIIQNLDDLLEKSTIHSLAMLPVVHPSLSSRIFHIII